MASPAVFWATVLFFASLSATSPSIVFPINSQVPPVARIGESFSFVLSPSTFTSSSPIPYSLSNAPKWLSVDSDARRLFGTPGPDDVPSGDVAGVPVNLVATDDTGSTTHTATLVVSRASAPTVEIPFEKQAPPDFGTFSSPSAILSGPGEAFSFQLDQDTFSKPPGISLSYYAIMADNTPLPAWISFDSRLLFTSQTPPAESLIQPPTALSFPSHGKRRGRLRGRDDGL